MDIYDRIELRAKELGISKAHISTTLGMTRTWLNSAQSYQTFLPPETVDKIAAILHTTPEYLRGETDNPDIKKDPQSSKDAGLSVDVQIMMQYAKLNEADKRMIDTMIARFLSRQE